MNTCDCCFCISLYLRKRPIHRNTALGIPKIILMGFFPGYTLIHILFKISWSFFHATIFVKVVYAKQKHLKDKLQCGHYFINNLFLQTARTACKGSVCIFLCQMWLAHQDDLFPQWVGLFPVGLMSFQNLFLRSQCFTFWSSHDTLCFSF